MEKKGCKQIKKAVFFDRDGTLNVDMAYLHKKEDFHWIEGAIEAIKYCHQQGYLVIVITNQSGVARGFFPESDIHALHGWMNQELAKAGTYIDDFYYCPHHPEGKVREYAITCNCRKPLPGLVERACQEHDIAPEASLMIGDRDRDVQCGLAAGTRGVLYQGGSLLDLVKGII